MALSTTKEKTTQTPTVKKKKTVSELQADALKWYKKIVGSSNPSASNFEIYRADHLKGKKAKLTPGVLLHFGYLAKHRESLPHWDAFPLSLVIDVGPDYLLSLNLHYVSPTVRLRFLKVMQKNLLDPDKSDLQKVKFNYAMMAESSKYSFMKGAIKKHLFSQIKSKPIPIPPSDFDKVIFLPSEDFVKASNLAVWKKSAKIGKK
jgi:hypothetical protein